MLWTVIGAAGEYGDATIAECLVKASELGGSPFGELRQQRTSGYRAPGVEASGADERTKVAQALVTVARL